MPRTKTKPQYGDMNMAKYKTISGRRTAIILSILVKVQFYFFGVSICIRLSRGQPYKFCVTYKLIPFESKCRFDIWLFIISVLKVLSSVVLVEFGVFFFLILQNFLLILSSFSQIKFCSHFCTIRYVYRSDRKHSSFYLQIANKLNSFLSVLTIEKKDKLILLTNLQTIPRRNSYTFSLFFWSMFLSLFGVVHLLQIVHHKLSNHADGVIC